MRLIVLVEWGPKRWTKAIVAPGECLRVGRHEAAELCMPHDEEMSGLHCELRWDGAAGVLRDLGRTNGTFLNGERVTEGAVAHGDWFQAGETVISVYVEGQASACTPVARKMRDIECGRASALAALRAEVAPLYGVFDTARSDRILPLLRCSPNQAQSLYEGRDGEELEDVAPYLVSLPTGSWLLERLIAEGWGDRWGIYLSCRRSFKDVRTRLRRNLLVNDPESGQPLYFRFYDPLALAVALAGRNARERQLLFGDIEAFVVEGAGGEALRFAAT